MIMMMVSEQNVHKLPSFPFELLNDRLRFRGIDHNRFIVSTAN
jgi:hypothetical protein